jgi:hypothetical protein
MHTYKVTNTQLSKKKKYTNTHVADQLNYICFLTLLHAELRLWTFYDIGVFPVCVPWYRL